MICELCSSSKQECKPLQKQHLEMLKQIDAVNHEKENKSFIGVCAQCEEMLDEIYQTKLEQEAEQEKLQMKMEKEELREIVKNLKNELDDTASSSRSSENFHETKIKMEESETVDSEFIGIEEFAWKDDTTEHCYDKEHMREQQQQFEKTNISSCNLSANCSETKVKIENSETMDIEEFTWNDDTITEIFNPSESSYNAVELNVQQHFDTASSGGSSSSSTENSNETNITIEISEIKDTEEFSLENYTTLEISNSAESCYDLKKLYIQELINEINETRPQEIIDWSSYIKIFDGAFYCRICGERPKKKYRDKKTAAAHIKIQHIGYRFTCTECKRCFTNRNGIKKHYKIIHNITNRLIALDKVIEQNDKTVVGSGSTKRNCLKNNNLSSLIKKIDNDFYCCVCGEIPKRYMHKKSVVAHINMQHFGYRFSCTECDRYFLDNGSLKRHYSRKHNISNGLSVWKKVVQQNDNAKRNCFRKIGNFFHCSLCTVSTKYTSIFGIRYHIQTVHRQNAAAAKVVSKTISKPDEIDNLSSLIKKLNDAFYCGICGERSTNYKDKQSLTIHIKIKHFGHRYTCTECKCFFVVISSLRKHYKRIHNITNAVISLKKATEHNYKPIGITKKNCIENTKLSSIIKKLDDAFYCGICGERSKKYTGRPHLVNHIKVQHLGYRFTCTECKRFFIAKISLKEHYKREHNITNGVLSFEKTIKQYNLENNYKKIGNFFHCTLCSGESTKYTSQNGIRYHIETVHSMVNSNA